jgi:hypothetical protein
MRYHFSTYKPGVQIICPTIPTTDPVETFGLCDLLATLPVPTTPVEMIRATIEGPP